MIEKVKKFICFNQGQLVQYEFLVAAAHKKLKEHLEKNELLGESEQVNHEDVFNEMFQNVIELDEIATAFLKKILKDNVEYIQNLFNIQDLHIATKLLDYTEDKKEVYIYDFFNSYHNYDLDECNNNRSLLKENTIYEVILENDESIYYAKDLIDDYKNDKYINTNLLESQKEKFKLGNCRWDECWKENECGVKHYYNTTIVKPMTLKHNKMDEQFIESFYEDGDSVIWGFVSLDSRMTGAFEDSDKGLSKETSKNLAHIVGDTLSLYFIFYYEHIQASKTFNKAVELVLNNMHKF